MHALIVAVDTHGDLMLPAIATPGNDFRLGACEVPPAIISTYLDDMACKASRSQCIGKSVCLESGYVDRTPMRLAAAVVSKRAYFCASADPLLKA